MLTFFYGWRRKVGCVTLVIALLFMGQWIRSQRMTDTFTWIPEEGPRFSITLSPYDVAWSSWDGSGQYVHEPWFMNINWVSIPVDEQNMGSITDYGWDVEWEWRCAGFRFGTYHVGSLVIIASTAIWSVPYWFIILVPTLISAWLSLSKSRKASTKPIAISDK